jgi:hypothetical protein
VKSENQKLADRWVKLTNSNMLFWGGIALCASWSMAELMGFTEFDAF